MEEEGRHARETRGSASLGEGMERGHGFSAQSSDGVREYGLGKGRRGEEDGGCEKSVSFSPQSRWAEVSLWSGCVETRSQSDRQMRPKMLDWLQKGRGGSKLEACRLVSAEASALTEPGIVCRREEKKAGARIRA